MTDKLMDLFDGKLIEREIDCAPWWLAGHITDATTGESWRYVYRSPLIRTTDPMHGEILGWLDGAAPVGQVEVHQDQAMMFDTGELTLWEA